MGFWGFMLRLNAVGIQVGESVHAGCDFLSGVGGVLAQENTAVFVGRARVIPRPIIERDVAADVDECDDGLIGLEVHALRCADDELIGDSVAGFRRVHLRNARGFDDDRHDGSPEFKRIVRLRFRRVC